jgi:PTS system cellobiose-specific IIC component
VSNDATSSRSLQTIQERLQPWAERISTNSTLLAIRDGVVATLPLIMLGSLFTLVASPPVKAWQDALAARPELTARLQIPFATTSLLISLYLAFSMGVAFAKRRNLDVTQGGLLSLAAFLVAMRPETRPGANGRPEWILPMPHLGAEGILVCILLAMFSVWVLAFFHQRRWVIRMPSSVPAAISQPFASLVPGLFVILVVWFLFHWLGFDLFKVLVTAFEPILTQAGDSLAWVLCMVFLDSALWLCGIHAVVLLALAKPIWLGLLTLNAEAAFAHQPLPHIAAWPFYNWFVWTGGSGAVLPLAFLMLRAKARTLRSVGRLSAPAVLFNINEPLLFGTPIVLNPTFAIPFFVAPAVAATLSWTAFSLGWVTRPFVLAPWTLPAPIGAYLSVGGDWRAVVLVVVNIIVCGLIYWPFFRVYDRQMLAREQADEDGGVAE